MNQIFIDTWAWYALVNTNDPGHLVAQITNEELLDQEYIFVTTNFVIDETLTLIRYHLGHTTAVQFWRQFQELVTDGLVEYLYIDAVIEQAAWQIFEKYDDQNLSFTDCTSFAVMQRHGLTEAFTGDHHFQIVGFILRP